MSCWILSNDYDGGNEVSNLLNSTNKYNNFIHKNKEVVSGYNNINNIAFGKWCYLYKNINDFKSNSPNNLQLNFIQYYELISGVPFLSRLTSNELCEYNYNNITLMISCFDYNNYDVEKYIVMKRNIIDQSVSMYINKRLNGDYSLIQCYHQVCYFDNLWKNYLYGIGERYFIILDYDELINKKNINKMFNFLSIDYNDEYIVLNKEDNFDNIKLRLINLLGGKHV
jgi:hypothetical protein